LQHSGQVLSRDHLLERVWPGTFVDDHALSVQILELRKALGDETREPKYIETRHRLGYCFKAKVDNSDDTASIRDARAAGPHPERPPETHYARSGDVNIAYQVIGDGPGRPAFCDGLDFPPRIFLDRALFRAVSAAPGVVFASDCFR
jgi:hypothetical protein